MNGPCAGVLLPMASIGLFMANIETLFSGIKKNPNANPLIGPIQMLLEGLGIAAFIYGLQLPNTVMLYWTTSNLCTLLQVHIPTWHIINPKT